MFEEAAIFHRRHPGAVVLPIATTGAAALMIHQVGKYDERLAKDLTYPSLFRRMLPLGGTPPREQEFTGRD